MQSTIAALIASGKGILAADESIPTIEERFKAVNIVSTEETRRAYREMLFTTPRLGACISGADGSHTIARCEEVATTTLRGVFVALCEHRVTLEETLLKTGMIVSGADCPQQADVAVVAETTVRCLRRAVPAAVPGIVFLSGGQSAVAATERLNAICRTSDAPWALGFSFGRALQTPALTAWNGLSSNVPAARAALLHRAQCNGAAVQGTYSAQMEHANT